MFFHQKIHGEAVPLSHQSERVYSAEREEADFPVAQAWDGLQHLGLARPTHLPQSSHCHSSEKRYSSPRTWKREGDQWASEIDRVSEKGRERAEAIEVAPGSFLYTEAHLPGTHGGTTSLLFAKWQKKPWRHRKPNAIPWIPAMPLFLKKP